MGLYRYARENLALVNIYIKDPAVTQVRAKNLTYFFALVTFYFYDYAAN